jgi:isopenicillin N synthase-like dioxygenase
MSVNSMLGGSGVPIIDLDGCRSDAATRRRIGRAIDTAFRDSGFMVIVGHGVTPDLIASMHSTTAAFFLQPDEEKLRYRSPLGSSTRRGFSRANYSAASRGEQTPPDLCEFFAVNRLGEPGIARREVLGAQFGELAAPNPWPNYPANFRDVWLEYFAAMEELSRLLMRLFALGLDLEEHYFAPFIDDHYTYMIGNFYPPQLKPAVPGQLRRGAHGDWGTLTILYQDQSPTGLEVLNRAGQWLPVAPIADSFVVNIGDLMAVWTNDRWTSTIHRVVNPPREAAREYRISIPFFHQPNFDALIECLPTCASSANPPRHRPVTSGEWVELMIRKASAAA